MAIDTEEWKKPSTIISIGTLLGTMIFNMTQCKSVNINQMKSELEMQKMQQEMVIIATKEHDKKIVKNRLLKKISAIDKEKRKIEGDTKSIEGILSGDVLEKRKEENKNKILALEKEMDLHYQTIIGL